jgi:hypothetical protein
MAELTTNVNNKRPSIFLEYDIAKMRVRSKSPAAMARNQKKR